MTDIDNELATSSKWHSSTRRLIWKHEWDWFNHIVVANLCNKCFIMIRFVNRNDHLTVHLIYKGIFIIPILQKKECQPYVSIYQPYVSRYVDSLKPETVETNKCFIMFSPCLTEGW